MKVIFTTGIAIAFLSTTTTSTEAQDNIVYMDDIQERNRQRALLKKREQLDPECRDALKAQALREADASAKEKFPGTGHRLGGAEGVNVLLGITAKEAVIVKQNKGQLSGKGKGSALKDFLKSRSVQRFASDEAALSQDIEEQKVTPAPKSVMRTTVKKKVTLGELRAVLST